MVKLTYNTQDELNFLFKEEGNYEFSKIIVNKCLEMINTDFEELTRGYWSNLVIYLDQRYSGLFVNCDLAS